MHAVRNGKSRALWARGALAVVFIAVLPAGSLQGGESGRFPAAVREIDRWIAGSAVKTPAGLTWPADPSDPKSVGLSLYSGAPGVVLFYLEAEARARTAGEVSLADGFLAKVRGGADDLLAHVADANLGTGLYEGAAGIAYVLEETYRTTLEMKYRGGFTGLPRIDRRESLSGKEMASSGARRRTSSAGRLGRALPCFTLIEGPETSAGSSSRRPRASVSSSSARRRTAGWTGPWIPDTRASCRTLPMGRPAWVFSRPALWGDGPEGFSRCRPGRGPVSRLDRPNQTTIPA